MLVILKLHINVIITRLATHCANVSMPGRCLPKMAPTPWKYAHGRVFILIVFATQTCNSALGALTGIAGTKIILYVQNNMLQRSSTVDTMTRVPRDGGTSGLRCVSILDVNPPTYRYNNSWLLKGGGGGTLKVNYAIQTPMLSIHRCTVFPCVRLFWSLFRDQSNRNAFALSFIVIDYMHVQYFLQ